MNAALRQKSEKPFHMDGTSHILHPLAAELFSILKTNSIAVGEQHSSPADSCNLACFVFQVYLKGTNRETHSKMHALTQLLPDLYVTLHRDSKAVMLIGGVILVVGNKTHMWGFILTCDE